MLLASSAHATDVNYTGNDLLNHMVGNVDLRAYALGYVNGVADASKMVCAPPPRTTRGQVRDVVQDFLIRNASIRHHPASTITERVLTHEWPCRGENEREI